MSIETRRPKGGGRLKRSLLALGGIFLVGGLFLFGLFLTARQDETPEYRASTIGAPSATLRLISCNLDWDSAQLDAVIAELDRLHGDYVLLQRVSRADAQKIAAALNMRYRGELQMFYSLTNPGTTAEPGNAILSRHPIYHGREMRAVNSRNYGILVESVVDGRRFLIGCVDLTSPSDSRDQRSAELAGIASTWEKAGRPPSIIGGTFSASDAVGERPMPNFTEALSQKGNPQRLLFSSHWAAAGGGVETAPSLSHRPVCLDARGAAPTSRPKSN